MKFMLFSWFFFFFSIPVFTQTWKELNNEIIEFYKKGEYRKAIPVAEKAMNTAKKESGEDHPDYASSLNNLALLYSNTGQYAKAEPLYIKALTISKKKQGENNTEYTTQLNNLASLYLTMGQFEKAERLYLQAKDIRKKVPGETHPDYAACLYHLALLYSQMGQYEKARLLFTEANGIFKNKLGEKHPWYAAALNGLTELYRNMGEYEKARVLILQTIEMRKKILGETHPDYAASLNNLAMLYTDMGQYEKAEPLYMQVKEINKKILGETHADYATSLNNLAEFYRLIGQYEKAEPLCIQAIEITRSALGEKHPNYAIGLNNLAALYQKMGQYEKAEQLYEEAKEIRKKILGEDHPDYALGLNNLAVLYQQTGQYGKAGQLYLQAAEIMQKALGEMSPGYAMSLNNLALVYSDMGQHEKAEYYYLKAIEIKRKTNGENNRSYATSLNNLAYVYSDMGQYGKAESLFLQANEILKKIVGENHPDYAVNLDNLAGFYSGRGQYNKAEPLLLLSSKIIMQNTRSSFAVLSEKEKGIFLEMNVGSFEMGNSLLYNQKNSSRMQVNNFNQLLFLKSLTLSDTRNILESAYNSKDSSIKKLFTQWQSNKTLLAKQYSLQPGNRMPDLKSKEAQTETLEKEINRRSAAFRDRQEALQVSLQDIQKQLQEDEAVVEFVRFRLYNKKWTDSVMFAAYLLRKNGSTPVFVPLCEEKQLQQLFDNAGKTATSMVSSFYRGLEIKNKNAASLGKELYKLVWQPLESYLKGVTKISYSPAGKLYSIAFHALPVDSATVLMDKYQLQQYTSTRDVALRNSENQATKPGSIVLFGDPSFTLDSLQLVIQKNNQPGKGNVANSIYTAQKRSSDNNTWNNLPGTAEEVNKIKQLFDQNKITNRSFVQTAASEENLKSLNANSPQIVHIATHGFFLPQPDKKKQASKFGQDNTYTLAEDPLLRSGLILSGGNYAWSGKKPVEGVEDGIATAYEISQLNLSNTELVVLSACETALGDVKGSEGVFGLQRAFKMAGVKKMIVSLWQVPDKETAELMTSFYSYWMKGKNINESFTQAQADMRKKYSPFYWAAFVLVE